MPDLPSYHPSLLQSDEELTEEEELEYEALSDYYASEEYALREDPPPDPANVLVGAAAAEWGRELVRRLGEGRPPLDPTAEVGAHARKRQVRLPGDLDRRLDAQAASEDRSVSEILRDALREYLARHPAS